MGGDVHFRRSGVTDYLAVDDEHALAMAREAVAASPVRYRSTTEPREIVEPCYPADEIYGVLPTDTRTPYDVREVIARLVDGSDFHEFKALYGDTLVCGFARVYGLPVAILANNGILFLTNMKFFTLRVSRRHTPSRQPTVKSRISRERRGQIPARVQKAPDGLVAFAPVLPDFFLISLTQDLAVFRETTAHDEGILKE